MVPDSVTLTLEMIGPGVVTAVPLEVLRCYIANLRGETAIYRGACVFAHLIELPGRTEQPGPPAPAAAEFVGTDKALKYLLERCVSSGAPGAGGVTLERTEVLHVLDLPPHPPYWLAKMLIQKHDFIVRLGSPQQSPQQLTGMVGLGSWRS